jgi:hypothetical protein
MPGKKGFVPKYTVDKVPLVDSFEYIRALVDDGSQSIDDIVNPISEYTSEEISDAIATLVHTAREEKGQVSAWRRQFPCVLAVCNNDMYVYVYVYPCMCVQRLKLLEKYKAMRAGKPASMVLHACRYTQLHQYLATSNNTYSCSRLLSTCPLLYECVSAERDAFRREAKAAEGGESKPKRQRVEEPDERK